MNKNHAERKHSKFSASGAERYFKCPGCVELSEGLPDKSSPWALEGTEAHEVLESILKAMSEDSRPADRRLDYPGKPIEMVRIAFGAAHFVFNLHQRLRRSELLVESRVFLDFVHPEAFGTLDSAVVDHFGTLHVLDFKYGAGVTVSPVGNLQMIFYAMALANVHAWNFKRVRMWIIQPRVKSYSGPLYWEIGILELKGWVETFKRAIDRVIENPRLYVEGPHCHWCKAKSICPLKRQAKFDEAQLVFGVKST